MQNLSKLRAAAGVLTTISLCLFVVGCGPENTLGRLPIKGTVTLDGAPLSNGSIHFESVGGERPINTGSVIEAGKYEVPAEAGLLPGKFKVSISSSGGPTETISDPEQAMDAASAAPAENKNLIPAKYNTDTELEAEVKADSENVFNFDLTSK